MSFPRVFQTVKFEVLGCPDVAHSAGLLQEHFVYHHFWSNVAVVQQRLEPLPHCDVCRMHIKEMWLINTGGRCNVTRTQRCGSGEGMW